MNWSAANTALVPSGVVTVMSTTPDPDGASAVIDVADSTETLVAAVDPNETPVASVNPVPVIVTVVPPPDGPVAGDTEVTVGAAAAYVYWSAATAALVPAGLVTVTLTVPSACAGAVATTAESLSTMTLEAATVPNDTAVTPVRLEPVMVTDVPPPFGPELGEIPVTTGVSA